MSEKANAKPQKYMNLKEILAYSLGLFGFQALQFRLFGSPALVDGLCPDVVMSLARGNYGSDAFALHGC